jgi:hypothetical protein
VSVPGGRRVGAPLGPQWGGCEGAVRGLGWERETRTGSARARMSGAGMRAREGRVFAHRFGRVGVGPAVEQQAHQREVAIQGGAVEARPAVLRKRARKKGVGDSAGVAPRCLLWSDGWMRQRVITFLSVCLSFCDLSICIHYIYIHIYYITIYTYIYIISL